MMSFARRENTRTYSEHENNGRNNCVSNSYMPRYRLTAAQLGLTGYQKRVHGGRDF